jgi:PPOX class probable F420-dependent enzyme
MTIADDPSDTDENQTMKALPKSHQDLITDEARAFAYLATTMADGSPQVTPLWFNTDGEHILINSAAGRIKDKNMRARPRIALLILDPSDPYRYMQVRGRVVRVTEDGALDHLNTLSLKYDRNPSLPRSGEVRVMYKIMPDRVFADQ